MPERTCVIDGCGTRVSTRGWCATHYSRWKRHGDPLHGGPVKKKSRQMGLSFDDRTERRGDCLIWTGPTDRDGYGKTRLDGRYVYAHRYAWERIHGPLPEGVMVDHRDHCDPACCEVAHLRPATKRENAANRAGALPGRLRALPRNVYYRVKGDTYFVRLTKDWKEHRFGTYKTVEEAAQVAERARREMFGEFSGRG